MAWEGIKLMACATGASLLSAWCLSQWFEPEPYTVWRGTSSPPDGPLAGAAAPQQRAEPAGVHISGNLYLPDTWGRDLTCLTLELDPAPTWARSRVPVPFLRW